MNLPLQKRQLCDIQGRLFELALKKGYDSPSFIRAFMNSKAAAALDDVYDRLQWAGEEYILEELNDEVNGLKKAGTIYDKDVMYWTGYVYRYWHYYTGQFSREIYKIADEKTMVECWLGFHTLDVAMAIDNLQEIYRQICEKEDSKMQHLNCIVVFNSEKNKLLFCKRTKEPYKGLYNFVGGKVEPEESSIHAAYRELEEETGISEKDINLFRLMDMTYYVENIVLEIYIGQLTKEFELMEEINPLTWLPLTEDFTDIDRFAGEQNIAHIVNMAVKHPLC